MEKQMELFARGGLKDEGGMIDEESGNRVPIGGTREGVRDDINANVSEGEFILSEDVTRYHGLEKLMNLRQEAKMGLKRMEAMGQIGNSDEATMPDDLPFGMDDLIIVAGGEPEDDGELNMAVGGLTTGTTNVIRTPDPVASVANNPVLPATTTGVRRLTPEITQPPRTNVDFKKFMGEASIEYKEYRNANGQNILIPFLDGKAMFSIPEGYTLYTGEGSIGTGTTPVDDIVADTNNATQEVRSRGSDDRTEVDVRPTPIDYDNISNEDLLKLAQDQTGTKGTIAKMAMAFMGPLGIFGMLAMSHQSKKIQETINKRIASGIIGNDLKGEFTEILGLLSKGSGGLLGGVLDFVGGLLGKTPEEIAKAKKTNIITEEKANPNIPLFTVNPRSGATELTVSVQDAVQSVLKDIPATATDQQMTERLTNRVRNKITEGQRQALSNAAFAPTGGVLPDDYDLAREAMAEVAPIGAVDALTGTPKTTYRDMSPEEQAKRASRISVAGVGAQLPTGTTTAVTPELTGLEQLEASMASTKQYEPINDLMPGEVREVAPTSYSSGAINMRPDALDIAPVTPVDTSTYTPPSSMSFAPTGTSADPQIQSYLEPLAERADPLITTPAIDYSTPSGTLPFMESVANQRNVGLSQTDAMLRGSSADPLVEPYVAPSVQSTIGGRPVYDTTTALGKRAIEASYLIPTGDPDLASPSVTPSTVSKQTTSAFPSYTPPSVSGIVPSKPIGSGRGEGAFEVAQRQADSSPTYTPDATQKVQGGFGVTPTVTSSTMDITTKPVARPSGLGSKTSTPMQTYKAGDSNQATGWMNLPDANIAQAADLNRRYAKTGGTAVDDYAVGAITDGDKPGVYADKDGFALRDENNRVVFKTDKYEEPVVKTTVYERLVLKMDSHKPAGKFNENEASTASTNKAKTVTPAKKNQLSKTAKAKIGTDASGGDPNMAGAVWTSQPGTNVLTRTFPKNDATPAPVTTTSSSSSGSSGGGSSSSGGGSSKIVCTAMNESYGFGSYRQAVWLKYSNSNLTKEHEVGYHTLFLPLVELAYQKDYKYVRKTLENIARHRTADLRAEMQNKKRDKLGRFYRAILEPICYLVGAYKMFRNK